MEFPIPRYGWLHYLIPRAEAARLAGFLHTQTEHYAATPTCASTNPATSPRRPYSPLVHFGIRQCVAPSPLERPVCIGSIQFKALHRAAEALNCTLV